MKKASFLYFILSCTLACAGVTGNDPTVVEVPPEVDVFSVIKENISDTNETVVRYDKYKVYQLEPLNDTQLNALKELQSHSKDMEFWTWKIVKDNPVRIMVSDEKYPILEEFMERNGLNGTVTIPNVQKLIDEGFPPSKHDSFSFFYYYDIDEIYLWLDYLVQLNPHILTPLTIGYSYEGRPIKGVKLSYKSNNPGVFIEAGIHAREWIAPATALWILNVLLTSQSSKIAFVAENYDWYIFPCVNPDGYHYSYTVDRFWRKTRSSVSPKCKGVDINRNWDFHWSGKNDPCSNTYPGPEPFSEPETKSLAKFLRSIADKIQLYLDFHSYSQLLIFPYSYTTEHVPSYDELMRIGKLAAESLAGLFGTNYTVGDLASTVYVANGSSLDWVYGTLNISLCYVYELRDRGEFGMLLPPKEIMTTGSETMQSILTILKEGRDIALSDYYYKKNITRESVEYD